MMAAERHQTFWRRLIAGIIDGLVLTPVGWLDNLFEDGDLQGVVLIAWWAFLTAIPLAYSIVLHWKKGQTVGKMVMGLTVLDVSEGPLPTFRQAFLRDIGNVAMSGLAMVFLVKVYFFPNGDAAAQGDSWWLYLFAFAGLGWFGLEVVTMLFDRKNRALHDHIAGTVVVKE